MTRTIRGTLLVFRLTGLFQLALGVVFWTGHALGLIPVHIGSGILFVLMLWVLAALAARAGAPSGLVALAVIWGLVLPAFGMLQVQLLPGPWHWLVRVLHLLTGLIGMGLGGRLSAHLGAGTRRVRTQPPVEVGWPEGGGL